MPLMPPLAVAPEVSEGAWVGEEGERDGYQGRHVVGTVAALVPGRASPARSSRQAWKAASIQAGVAPAALCQLMAQQLPF